MPEQGAHIVPWGLPKYIDNSMGHEIVPISSKTSANFLTAFHASMIPFKTREMEQFGKLTVSGLRCANEISAQYKEGCYVGFVGRGGSYMRRSKLGSLTLGLARSLREPWPSSNFFEALPLCIGHNSNLSNLSLFSLLPHHIARRGK